MTKHDLEKLIHEAKILIEVEIVDIEDCNVEILDAFTKAQQVGQIHRNYDKAYIIGKCICQIRGIRPFLSPKFDITKHKNYKYLSDFDKKNTFDVEKYLKDLRKPSPKLKPNQPFIFIDIEDKPGDVADIEDMDTIGEIE